MLLAMMEAQSLFAEATALASAGKPGAATRLKKAQAAMRRLHKARELPEDEPVEAVNET
jgi:hypothetical protein